jgi:hypothetical protein
MVFNKKFTLLITLLVFITSFTSIGARGSVSIEVPQVTASESQDFATLILRDPWDMSEFTDISPYLNESGQRIIINNPSVENGVFSGISAGNVQESNNGYFFTLFPGYETAMLIGKVGHRYPIDAKEYHCLYISMKVDSPATNGTAPDQFRVFWFADERLNSGGAPYGATRGIFIYSPEPDTEPLAHIWKLFRVDLADPPNGFDPTKNAWTEQAQWQGLRIDPTIYGDTAFAVDWVRLTNCQPNLQEITWSPDSSIATLWLKPAKTSRYIRVATDLNGQSGSYKLDIQGLPPGKYTVGLSHSLSDCCIVESKESLIINQTPIAKFANPSFYSGIDYSTQTGNPWDFQDEADASSVQGTSYYFSNGVLDLITQSSGGGADPKIFLRTPQDIDDSQEYRYLSFRMYTEGPWQNTPQGMIGRWIWTQPVGGSNACHRVSHDIPLDVGWQVYWIDLSDPFTGSAEEVAGSCEGLGWHWLDSSLINKLRFDPNENILGIPLHQQLDWIRLTKIPSVTRGTSFPIRIGLNKPPSEVSSITYYYTDDVNDPTQNRAKEFLDISLHKNSSRGSFQGDGLFSSELKNAILLPITMKNFVPTDLPFVENEVTFNWDTSMVKPGEYYTCVLVSDDRNEATYCSEAPMRVLAP